MGVRLCICMHCGPQYGYSAYASMVFIGQEVVVYGFKQYEEMPIWHTVPYRPTSSTESIGLSADERIARNKRDENVQSSLNALDVKELTGACKL